MCKCFFCDGEFTTDGVAYIMGGGTVDYTRTNPPAPGGLDLDSFMDLHVENFMDGYLDIGFHSNPVDRSVNHNVVENTSWGQFDISFCSLRCLKQWFLGVISSLEEEYANNLKNAEYEDNNNST
ncbi:hypothetical protein FACS1894170_10050 [Planctomycetales bacterium]|nr:hypothetical protein FACS1894170_10050 [Planctomycetales bacterium]